MIAFRGLTPDDHRASWSTSSCRSWRAQLADQRVHLEVDALAHAWLGEKGYDPLYGARPLARVIQEHIKRPLADELLFGKLAKGGKVVVTIKDGQPAFECTPASIPALLPPPDGMDADLPGRRRRRRRRRVPARTRRLIAAPGGSTSRSAAQSPRRTAGGRRRA